MMPNKRVLDAIKGGDTTALVALLKGLRYDLECQAQQHDEMAAKARARAHEITEALEHLGGSDGDAGISSGGQVSRVRGEEPAPEAADNENR
jgi:hypothetical protein